MTRTRPVPKLPISLNQTKAAEFIGVSRDTLAAWTRRGLIRAHKMGEGRNCTVLYSIADLYQAVGLDVDGTPIGEDGS